MTHHPVVRVGTKLLLPFILLFSLYVQFHGDYGPGGGFQAGVIFGAGVILYGLVFEVDRLSSVVPRSVLLFLASFGVLLYASIGVTGMILGGTFLDYNVLASDPHDGQHVGVLLVELAVGITVASVMVLLFLAFASRRNG